MLSLLLAFSCILFLLQFISTSGSLDTSDGGLDYYQMELYHQRSSLNSSLLNRASIRTVFVTDFLGIFISPHSCCKNTVLEMSLGKGEETPYSFVRARDHTLPFCILSAVVFSSNLYLTPNCMYSLNDKWNSKFYILTIKRIPLQVTYT